MSIFFKIVKICGICSELRVVGHSPDFQCNLCYQERIIENIGLEIDSKQYFRKSILSTVSNDMIEVIK